MKPATSFQLAWFSLALAAACNQPGKDASVANPATDFPRGLYGIYAATMHYPPNSDYQLIVCPPDMRLVQKFESRAVETYPVVKLEWRDTSHDSLRGGRGYIRAYYDSGIVGPVPEGPGAFDLYAERDGSFSQDSGDPEMTMIYFQKKPCPR